MPERGAPEWMVPVFASGIIIATIVGLIVPLFANVAFADDEVVRWTLPGALAIVAIASPLQLRFLVLPNVLSGKMPGETLASHEQLATTATVLVCAFSLSDAIYGTVLSILLDNSLWALPFGAFGLLSLAVLVPYVNGELDRRRRERMSTGAP